MIQDNKITDKDRENDRIKEMQRYRKENIICQFLMLSLFWSTIIFLLYKSYCFISK